MMNLREYSNSNSNCALIFIHGILSDGFDAWYEENEGVFWPRLINNSPALSNIDIFSVSYPTNIFLRDYGPNEICTELKVKLETKKIFERDKIIFVCHSMGGIIARRFLVKYSSEFIDREIVTGLFLVASPSNGSGYANFLGLGIRLLKIEQGDILRKNSPFLKTLHSDFLSLYKQDDFYIVGREILEQKFIFKIPFLKPIVERISGANYFDDPILIPKSDHCSIAKPISENDTQHESLILLIHKVLVFNRRNENKIKANLRRSELIHLLKHKVKQMIEGMKLLTSAKISFDKDNLLKLYNSHVDSCNDINSLLANVDPNNKLYQMVFNLLDLIDNAYLFCISETQSRRDTFLKKLNYGCQIDTVDFNELNIEFNLEIDDTSTSLFFKNWNSLVSNLLQICNECVEKTAESPETLFNS